MNGALRRVIRTLIQLVAGLSVVTVWQLFGPHIPAAYVPLAYAAVTAAITSAQNYAEAHHLMPILLPNAHPGVGATPPAPPAP